MDGDGYDDLIIGVPYASLCYVLMGTPHGFVNMSRGFMIYGVQSFDLTGWSVSGAGDVNNDTFADIIIGAPSAINRKGVASGVAYVIYGGPSVSNVFLSNMTRTQGYAIYGVTSQDALGLSVSGAGINYVNIYSHIYLFLICSILLLR